jgi:hypothetical protein
MGKYNEDFRFEDGALSVSLSGDFPNELLHKGTNLFQPLADACAAHRCQKALIDARGLHVDLGTLGLFRAAEDLASMTRMGLHIAILATEDMLDPFFEDVASNRGGIVGVFTKMDTALEWLEKH